MRFSARFMHPKFALLRRDSLTIERTFPLKLLCARAITRGVQPEYDDTEIRAVKTGTLRNGELDWSEAQTVSEACFEAAKFRAEVRRNDVLVSSTGGGSLGKIDLYNLDTPALADGHIAIVRLRAGSHEPALLVHLMRQRVVQWQIEQGLTGSTNQIDIYPEQIEALRIPRLDAKKRVGLLKKIEAIERDIATARAAVRKPEDIINEILCAEFGYPLREHRERVRERHFARTLGTLAAGFTLRGSAKSHHPDFELTDAFFSRVPHERVKAFVAVPIRLGATATKGDFIEDGAAYYVHPGATKRQRPRQAPEARRPRRPRPGATLAGDRERVGHRLLAATFHSRAKCPRHRAVFLDSSPPSAPPAADNRVSVATVRAVSFDAAFLERPGIPARFFREACYPAAG